MGRLTLNVLLSFAQFEREVTAERIRDKVAASKKKGMWMGGAVPFGYDAKEKALVVNRDEAEAVRTIFGEYLSIGSVPKLRSRLETLSIISKRRTDRNGRVTGGQPFSTGALYHLLRNATYIGMVGHKGKLHDGQHDAIIDETIWKQVHQLLDGNGGGAIAGRRKPARRVLDGLLFDRHGRPMRSTYAMRSNRASGVRQSKRYFYYTSKRNGPEDHRAADRLPAAGLEAILGDAIRSRLGDHTWVASSLSGSGPSPEAISKALERARQVTGQIANASREIDGSAHFLHRVDLQNAALRIQLNLSPLLEHVEVSEALASPIEVPITLRRSGRNRPIVLRADLGAPERDPDLISLVADAKRWMDGLIEGRAASVAAITKSEQLRLGNVSRVLPLAWLAPDIAAAILEGRQPADMTAKTLRDVPDLPLDWSEQRRVLGFPVA